MSEALSNADNFVLTRTGQAESPRNWRKSKIFWNVAAHNGEKIDGATA